VAESARRMLVGSFFAIALSLSGARSDARISPVALGEVHVPKPDATLRHEFRNLVQHELGRLNFDDVRPRDRYVLSAALLQISTHQSDGQSESVAVVSATLRSERGGTLHAMLEGRAQAVEAPDQARNGEQTAMRAAVRSALTRVPEALK
jgi:hypothetical protein